MRVKPTGKQILCRGAITGLAATVLVGAFNLSESRLGVHFPFAAQALLLFVLFFFAALIPLRQPNTT